MRGLLFSEINMGYQWKDRYEVFGHLGEDQLFALARNDSAKPEVRKLAIELMLKKNYKKARHPDISVVLADFLADVAEVEHESEVAAPPISPVSTQLVPAEKAVEPPVVAEIVPIAEAEEPAGPLKASFTTASFFGAPEVIDNRVVKEV